MSASVCIVAGYWRSLRNQAGHHARRRAPAQATLDFLVLLPLLLVLLFGLLGAGRLVSASIGVSAVAREAARAGAVAAAPAEAAARARSRGQQVGGEYGLGNGTLNVQPDVSHWGPQGEVSVTATYILHLADVPLVRLGDITLQRTDGEVVGPWRTLASP
jgi:hypothetical protein